MRTVFKLLLLLGATGYLCFAVFRFSAREDDAQCRNVNIVIADSARATLITAIDVEQMLRRAGLHPLGRRMKEVRLLDIERKLMADPFIERAMGVKTPGDNVQIYVKQRLPLLRILAANGDDYYIDDKGFRMEARGYEADLAIVTGSLDERYAKKHLVELGKLLRDDPFWNAQVQQVNVRPNHDLELVMRVGRQMVLLGKAEHLHRKFRNLRAFYEKVLPSVGWHRYEAISVAYENQVIGIKKEVKP